MMPKSNIDYWHPKLENNKMRDAANVKLLEEKGWSILIVWECEFNNNANYEELKHKVIEFLGKKRSKKAAPAISPSAK